MTTETGYLIRYRSKDGSIPFYLHFNWKHEDDSRAGCVLGCHNKNVCCENFRSWLRFHPDREQFLTEHIVEVVKVEVDEKTVETLNLPGDLEFVG